MQHVRARVVSVASAITGLLWAARARECLAFRRRAGTGTLLAPPPHRHRHPCAGYVDRALGMALAFAHHRTEFDSNPNRIEATAEARHVRAVVVCAVGTRGRSQ